MGIVILSLLTQTAAAVRLSVGVYSEVVQRLCAGLASDAVIHHASPRQGDWEAQAYMLAWMSARLRSWRVETKHCVR